MSTIATKKTQAFKCLIFRAESPQEAFHMPQYSNTNYDYTILSLKLDTMINECHMPIIYFHLPDLIIYQNMFWLHVDPGCDGFDYRHTLLKLEDGLDWGTRSVCCVGVCCRIVGLQLHGFTPPFHAGDTRINIIVSSS